MLEPDPKSRFTVILPQERFRNTPYACYLVYTITDKVFFVLAVYMNIFLQYMQMKTYAEIQTNLTTWNTKDAGYVISGFIFFYLLDPQAGTILLGRDLYQVCFAASFILTFASLIVILFMICKKTPKNFESAKLKIWHSLFWTSVGVLTQFSAVLLIIDIVSIDNWCKSLIGCSVIGDIKLIWIIFTVIFAIVICLLYTLLFFVKYMKRREVPSVSFLEVEKEKLQLLFPPIISSVIFVFCHTCGKPKFSTYVFNIALSFTTVVFLSIFFFYLVPVLVLLLVYPIKVASAYTFLTAALVLYILIAFFGEYKRLILLDSNEETNKLLKFIIVAFYLNLPLLNMMLIGLMLYLFISVYNVISDGYSENSVLHAIVFFLPSVILSFFIWLFKKQLLKWLDKKEDATSNTDTPFQRSRQQEHSDDSTSDVDTQQEHSEQDQLFHPQRQYGTSELEQRV